MFGAPMIMLFITILNMRRFYCTNWYCSMYGLSSLQAYFTDYQQLILAMSHAEFCFLSFRGNGWYLSFTAALLYYSYFTHNVVAWMKFSPFFTGSQASFRPTVCKCVRWVYLSTLAMSAPVIIFEIVNNFLFFNTHSRYYERVRLYKPMMRDFWWIFSCLTFFFMSSKSAIPWTFSRWWSDLHDSVFFLWQYAWYLCLQLWIFLQVSFLT